MYQLRNYIVLISFETGWVSGSLYCLHLGRHHQLDDGRPLLLVLRESKRVGCSLKVEGGDCKHLLPIGTGLFRAAWPERDEILNARINVEERLMITEILSLGFFVSLS